MNEREEAKAWTTTHELLAQIVEWLSLLRVEHLAIWTKKGVTLPDTYHVPRPGEEPDDGVVVMNPREFAQMMAAP